MCNYSFLSFTLWKLMKIYLCINVNEKCKLDNFVLVNQHRRVSETVPKWNYICCSFRQGGEPSLWTHFHVYLYYKQKRLSTFLRKLNVKLQAYCRDFGLWMNVFSSLFSQKKIFLPLKKYGHSNREAGWNISAEEQNHVVMENFIIEM